MRDILSEFIMCFSHHRCYEVFLISARNATKRSGSLFWSNWLRRVLFKFPEKKKTDSFFRDNEFPDTTRPDKKNYYLLISGEKKSWKTYFFSVCCKKKKLAYDSCMACPRVWRYCNLSFSSTYSSYLTMMVCNRSCSCVHLRAGLFRTRRPKLSSVFACSFFSSFMNVKRSGWTFATIVRKQLCHPLLTLFVRWEFASTVLY